MRFGPVPAAAAESAILAHSLTVGDARWPKARRLSAADVRSLRAAGIDEVIAARLDPDDMDEDAAAERLAAALRSDNLVARPAATGRVNLHAAAAGVFSVDADAVAAINGVDPAITLATLADKVCVEAGQMVATVKIIPFAVPSALVQAALDRLAGKMPLRVDPFDAKPVLLIQTELPGIKPSVLDKTRRVTQARLDRSGSAILAERRVAHDGAALAAALRGRPEEVGLVLVFGASALCDFDDVIPFAIREAGGVVLRAGMPVDPGNLLVLGRIGTATVIGAPGCARSPKENGFDWVLDRVLAGLDVTSADIAAMGVGGLLMEIPSRPQPREPRRMAAATAVHAVVLAAGRSSRMGGPNKLLARFDGVPLIRRVVRSALASGAASVTVVTGHQRDRIEAALDGLDIRLLHNPDYAAGLSTTLRAGVEALPPEAAGAAVILGDMPDVTAADLKRLVDAFSACGGAKAVRASHDGKRGNPVILPRAVFAAVARLEGDTGARHIVEREDCGVVDVEIGPGASLDVDTAEAMQAAGGVLQD